MAFDRPGDLILSPDARSWLRVVSVTPIRTVGRDGKEFGYVALRVEAANIPLAHAGRPA